MSDSLDPFLLFVQEQLRQGKNQIAPWTCTNPELLNLAKTYFPEIPIIPAEQLQQPNLGPVAILPLQDSPPQAAGAEEFQLIAVGGPPAATVALQAVIQGKRVLYVSDLDLNPPGKQIRPIWAGAGNHGETDVLTEGPAYLSDYYPLTFMLKEFLRFMLPGRLQKNALDPDYPWLNLNLNEWIRNPRQWLTGLRVFWGNFLLARKYDREVKQGKEPEIIKEMAKRVKDSGEYLEHLNQAVVNILRKPRGSLILAPSQSQAQGLRQFEENLRKQGQQLKELSSSDAEKTYGLLPQKSLCMMEKTHDFIFEADFLPKINEQIQKQGGQVINNWRLNRIFVDAENNSGGILEFYELNSAQEKVFHYKKFARAHLSLGATTFSPSVYDLISVTGVSMNALVIGANLHGGPIVCGGTNHMVPVLEPRLIEMKEPGSAKTQSTYVSFVRLSTGGCVNPLDRGRYWYHYDGKHALHLAHRVQETLPQPMSLKILSVIGCNRVIGKDGRQVEIHPRLNIKNQSLICECITIQSGAGGGGLTQMGALPQRMMQEPSFPSAP